MNINVQSVACFFAIAGSSAQPRYFEAHYSTNLQSQLTQHLKQLPANVCKFAITSKLINMTMLFPLSYDIYHKLSICSGFVNMAYMLLHAI
jgi:hypothetical protein